MTRKTQIGLLTAASMLCCVGVFIGARMSGGSHVSTEAAKPAVTDNAPPNPTPVQEVTPAPERPSEKPTMLAKIEEPLSPPPDLDPMPAIDQASAKPAPDSLPPLPSESIPPPPAPDIKLIRADEPASDNKTAVTADSKLPVTADKEPAKKPDAKPADVAIELPPPLPSAAPLYRELAAQKELTERTPQTKPPVVSPLEPPPAVGSVSADNVPPTILPSPSSVDPPLKFQAQTKPDPSETLPPARIVPPPIDPVPPPTVATATTPVTAVVKKPAVAKLKSLPLTGTHPCKLDDKHGLVLPKAAREQMGEQDTLFVTFGSDHCVWLTTAAGLEKLTDRMEKPPADEDEAKVARRRYFAQTERIAVDKAGYLVVPAALLESAGLKHDAVVIGVGDHLELWDAQRWQKYSQTLGADTETSAGESHEEL